jgi:hypothetical protein
MKTTTEILEYLESEMAYWKDQIRANQGGYSHWAQAARLVIFIKTGRQVDTDFYLRGKDLP